MPTKKTRHVRLQTDRHVLERYYEDTYSNYPYYQCHNRHNWDSVILRDIWIAC